MYQISRISRIEAARFIDKFTNTMMTFHGYMMEIECWKHEDLDYVALSHANLNVDNAYYWRDEEEKLCCGVLDWGGFGASCLGHKLWWYFNCSEFELLKAPSRIFMVFHRFSWAFYRFSSVFIGFLSIFIAFVGLGSLRTTSSSS